MLASIFAGMGRGTQSGKLLFNQIYSGSDLNIVGTLNNLAFSVPGVTFSNILFVDPNGDANDVQIGNLKKPWNRIEAAVSYITSNNITSNPSIYVFPGDYQIVSKITASINFSIHLMSGASIDIQNIDGFLDIVDCNIKITSESRRWCVITSNADYFCHIRSGSMASGLSASLHIENTSIVSNYTPTSDNTLFLINSRNATGRCELNFENCHVKINNSYQNSSTFKQGGPSLLSFSNSEIYQINTITSSSIYHVIFHLNSVIDDWTKLSLNNTKIYLSGYESFVYSNSNSNPKNIIFLNNCVLQSTTGSTTSHVIVTDSATHSHLVTYGNSIRNNTQVISGVYLSSDSTESNKSGYVWGGLTNSNSFSLSWL